MKTRAVLLLDAIVHVRRKVTEEVRVKRDGWWREMHNIYEALPG